MYLFQIVDEGLIKRVVGRVTLEELIHLVTKELEEYLSENGFEGQTDDGYANIIELDLTGKQNEVHLWSYSFDGTESIESAAKRISIVNLIIELGKTFWKQGLNDDDIANEMLELMIRYEDTIQYDEALLKAYRELTIWSRTEIGTGEYLDTVHDLLKLDKHKPKSKTELIKSGE